MPTPQEQFIANIYPGAKKISDETGSSVEIILAQTALETGWGQKILPGTNNLYNIKADASWKGKSAEFTVPEEDKKNGKVYVSKEKFRVYDSYAESMADRAKFLAENHRYEKAGLYKPEVKGNLEKEAQAIANAGYADVDIMKAIQTPLSQSSEEAVANIRANEHAEMQKGQQQPAQQQASDIQQQSTILQR